MRKKDISDFYMDLLRNDKIDKRSYIVEFRTETNDLERQTSLMDVMNDEANIDIHKDT